MYVSGSDCIQTASSTCMLPYLTVSRQQVIPVCECFWLYKYSRQYMNITLYTTVYKWQLKPVHYRFIWLPAHQSPKLHSAEASLGWWVLGFHQCRVSLPHSLRCLDNQSEISHQHLTTWWVMAYLARQLWQKYLLFSTATLLLLNVSTADGYLTSARVSPVPPWDSREGSVL